MVIPIERSMRDKAKLPRLLVIMFTLIMFLLTSFGAVFPLLIAAGSPLLACGAGRAFVSGSLPAHICTGTGLTPAAFLFFLGPLVMVPLRVWSDRRGSPALPDCNSTARPVSRRGGSWRPQMGYATYGAATQNVILLNLKPADAAVSPPHVIAIQAR